MNVSRSMTESDTAEATLARGADSSPASAAGSTPGAIVVELSTGSRLSSSAVYCFLVLSRMIGWIDDNCPLKNLAACCREALPCANN